MYKLTLIALALSSSHSQAAQTDYLNSIASRYKISIDAAAACLRQTPMPDQQKLCFEQAVVERMEVKGRYTGPEAPELAGRFHLNRQFIERAPKSTGDINELVSLMPGVQLSEDAYAVSEVAEIRAKQLSISGGQPWQTGFILNGVSYNSRLDPASYSSSLGDFTQVQGSAQSFTLNSFVVDSIDVYDSNVPADYGNFSGGVVEVKSRDAFAMPKLLLGVRGTDSDWGRYHQVGDEILNANLSYDEAPVFRKRSYDLALSQQFNQQHALALTFNYLSSEQTELSLGEQVRTARQSTNAVLTYSQRDVWLDKINLHLAWAPYRNRNLLLNTKDSRFVLDGGGANSSLQAEHQLSIAKWYGNLGFNQSDNSRQANNIYRIWLQAKGTEWGQLDPANAAQGATLVSKEGGRGGLDNEQQNLSTEQKLLFDRFAAADSWHQFSLGFQFEREQQRRQRRQNVYYYNSARQYSSNTAPLDCNGYEIDCQPLTFQQPLTELVASLGRPLDLTRLDDLTLYSANIVTTPQYFESRLVYPQERLTVTLQKAGLFLTDQIDWHQFEFQLGLRLDQDDFFNNLTLSPRLAGGYRVGDDPNTLLTFGLNRYYDAGLITYKMRAEQLPYRTEYRPVRQGIVQSWLASSAESDVRYRYQNVATPYDDETTLGYKHLVEHWGTFSVKAVWRWKRQQLGSATDAERGADGYRYLSQTNEGTGYSRRLSLAWHHRWLQHSIWANTSFSKTFSSTNSYDEAVANTPQDELVYLDNELTSLSRLNRQNTNFARPLLLNFGVSSDWTDKFSTALTGVYTGGYDAAVDTGSVRASGQLKQQCPECESSNILIPVYATEQLPAKWLLNLSLRLDYPTASGDWQLNADISNLLDSRTYTVGPGQVGIEVGRQFWLGARYAFD